MGSMTFPYIDFECGEIYEMDKEEVPLIYAAKANRINGFKTLKVYTPLYNFFL